MGVCAARDYPVRGLAGHGGNVVEVGIVVQYGCAVVLGRGGGEQVHHAGGAVLACGGEKRLDLAGPAGDLVGAGELDQLTAYSEDPLVSPGLAGRVAQFQVDRHERRQHAVGGQPPQPRLGRRDPTLDRVGRGVGQVQRRHRRAPRITSSSRTVSARDRGVDDLGVSLTVGRPFAARMAGRGPVPVVSRRLPRPPPVLVAQA
jgi:hypothetical protein